MQEPAAAFFSPTSDDPSHLTATSTTSTRTNTRQPAYIVNGPTLKRALRGLGHMIARSRRARASAHLRARRAKPRVVRNPKRTSNLSCEKLC